MRKPKRRFTVSVETLEGRLLMSAAPQFNVKDLGIADIRGINVSGQVVGSIHYGMQEIAGVSDLNGDSFDLVGVENTSGTGINDLGQVTGIDSNFGGQNVFVFSKGVTTNIGSLGESHYQLAYINNLGNVVTSIGEGGREHASFYNGTWHDLGTFGGTRSLATGINDSNQIVGNYSDLSGKLHAFFYDTTMHDLGALGGPQSTSGGINSFGQVTGGVWKDDGTCDVYISDPNGGTLHNVGRPANSSGAGGCAINDYGHIVGTAQVGNSIRAFYYNGLVMMDLNNLIQEDSGFVITEAYGINNSDQIAVNGIDKEGQQHALLLTPIYPTSINVLPAPLTVTANNVTRIYGQPLPPLTGTIMGLVNGDTDVATYSTTATVYSPTGTYPITPALTDSNYNITLVNGTLTQAPVRLFVESYYLARYPNVATIVASGRYSSAFAYFKAVGVYMGDMATPDWTPAIEQTYLTANPDVARAVTSGSLKSGYEHFFLYGQYQNRAGAPPLT